MINKPETKKELKPFLGERVQYTALIERVDYGKRLALLREVKLENGEKIDHLWVNLTERILKKHTQKKSYRKRYTFSGIVTKYYGLTPDAKQVVKYGVFRSKLHL